MCEGTFRGKKLKIALTLGESARKLARVREHEHRARAANPRLQGTSPFFKKR